MNFVNFDGLFALLFDTSAYPLLTILLSCCVILFCVAVIVRVVSLPFRGI